MKTNVDMIGPPVRPAASRRAVTRRPHLSRRSTRDGLDTSALSKSPGVLRRTDRGRVWCGARARRTDAEVHVVAVLTRGGRGPAGGEGSGAAAVVRGDREPP